MKPHATWKLGDSTLELRPLRPGDEAPWLKMMRSLSWATRYKRGARQPAELTLGDARRAVGSEPDTTVALAVVATRESETEMSGVCTATLLEPAVWEFALVVLDEWQRRGVGRRLMRAVIDELKRREAGMLAGDVLASNRNMLDFVARLGFEILPHEQAHLKRVQFALRPPEAPGGAGNPKGLD